MQHNNIFLVSSIVMLWKTNQVILKFKHKLEFSFSLVGQCVYCFINFSNSFCSRDFAAASMIGGSGLLGKSWPDLDMLPLGWLTDAGESLFSIDYYKI